MDPNELYDAADRIRAKVDSNTVDGLWSLYYRLEEYQANYASDWKGCSKNEFETRYRDLKRMIYGGSECLIDLAYALADALVAAAEDYANSDTGGNWFWNGFRWIRQAFD